MDAAHFTWTVFLGYLWCFFRIWKTSPSGRQRFNVLGALNAVTKEVITVCNITYINSWSILEMFFKLRKRKLSYGLPISIVLDNAGYQTCYLVRGAAYLMGIDLVFLPAYSPNLNLIERLWKHVKQNCIANQTYETFDEFCFCVQNAIEQAHLKEPEKMASLLTWNFQTFPKLRSQTTQAAA
jgi:transposase